jgi:ribosomal protein S18 acetylase RimI-like enzyme
MTAAQLQRIHAYLRVAAPRGRDCERIGPFLATFNRDSDNRYLNYAIPDDGAQPTPDDVAALVDTYRARGRAPRLEYVTSLAPAVEPALLAAGFEVEGRLPLMMYRGDGEKARPEGIAIIEARSDEELRGVAAVQWDAYEEQGAVPERAVDSLRATVAHGGLVVLARDAATGEAAGGGLCTGPHEGATELTSVGVRERYRRRGIAEAMTRWLAREMHARGNDCVFLMADGPPEERIYARAGFETVSDILHISHGRGLSPDLSGDSPRTGR